MAQVSRYPLPKKIYERIFEILFQSVAKIKNKKEAEEFFNDFLTPTERIMLAKRLAIAVLLSRNYDYRSIRKVLNVSPPTIAAVSIALKYTGEGYRKIVDRLLGEEAIKESLLEVLGDLAELGSLGGSEVWRGVRKGLKKRKKKSF